MLLDQAREPAQFAIRLAMHNAIMLVPMWDPESESIINPPISAHNTPPVWGYTRFQDSTVTKTKFTLKTAYQLKYGKSVLCRIASSGSTSKAIIMFLKGRLEWVCSEEVLGQWE